MALAIDSVWNLYLATRLHYLHDYDAVKYKGKLKDTQVKQQRPDKVLVKNSLMDLEDKRDVIEYCIANFLYENDNFLYGSCSESDEFYLKWSKYWKSAKHSFEADISQIELSMHKRSESLEEYFATSLYTDVLKNSLKRETVCILAYYFPSSIALMNGFGADKFKKRVIKTLPFIKRRLDEMDVNLEMLL
ncbi:MAG TPA: hypothetical protein VFM18_09920 [Methanosarcina sp.]|nr:hypothetical protein [Methanosarcina sp.]